MIRDEGSRRNPRVWRRATSNSGGYSPKSVAALRMWLAPNMGQTVVSSKLTAWADQSGNGNNWTAHNAGPQFTNTLNGLPTVGGASNTEYIIGPTTATIMGAATQGEWMMVIAAPDNTSNQPFLNTWGSSTNCYHKFSGSIYDDFCSTTRQNFASAGSTPYVFGASSINGNWTAYLNGSQAFTTGTNTFTKAAVNQTFVGAPGFTAWLGQLGEVIVYGTVLSAGDRAALVAWLRARWGF